jgi:xanthine dehydrogenase accessory factor
VICVDNDRIFSFLTQELAAKRSAILVSVISVTGSSMRDPGAHMAVAQDGRFTGSLSGGCIENAVVAEALQCLEQGEAKIVRFGQGSPYIDIKLPCGGGLDIHFQPLRDNDFAAQCLNAVQSREPFAIRLSAGETAPEFVDHWQPHGFDAQSDQHVIGHWPPPRLMLIGHGAAMLRLANLAQAIDVGVITATPQVDLRDQFLAMDIDGRYLNAVDDVEAVLSDRWTAIVFLFHDHDWEVHLLAAALTKPHFYIGAMGGRTAQLKRKEMLQGQGVSSEVIKTIRAPIGLFHSARDPDTLAISTLAEIVKSYQNTDFSSDYD